MIFHQEALELTPKTDRRFRRVSHSSSGAIPPILPSQQAETCVVFTSALKMRVLD